MFFNNPTTVPSVEERPFFSRQKALLTCSSRKIQGEGRRKGTIVYCDESSCCAVAGLKYQVLGRIRSSQTLLEAIDFDGTKLAECVIAAMMTANAASVVQIDAQELRFSTSCGSSVIHVA